MPEEIYAQAGGDRDKAMTLLHQYGYITDPSVARRVLTGAQLAARTAEQVMATATTGEAAFDSVPAGMGRSRGVPLTRTQHSAMRDYQSNFFSAINGQLRREGEELGPMVASIVSRLDAAMAVSPLRRDVVTYRGITDASRLFGPRLEADMTGFEWRELAYSSTTAAERIATSFADTGAGHPVMLRVLARQGTHALRIGDFYDQAEVLLERGLTFRVVRDRGMSPRGFRLLDVEVVPR